MQSAQRLLTPVQPSLQSILKRRVPNRRFAPIRHLHDTQPGTFQPYRNNAAGSDLSGTMEEKKELFSGRVKASERRYVFSQACCLGTSFPLASAGLELSSLRYLIRRIDLLLKPVKSEGLRQPGTSVPWFIVRDNYRDASPSPLARCKSNV